MNKSPIKIIKTNAILGEGLSFLRKRKKVISFDIIGKKLFLLSPYEGWEMEIFDIPFKGSCAMELIDGRVLIAGDLGLHVTADFKRFSTILEHDDDLSMRTNDGFEDPSGKFWYSLMRVDADNVNGCIYRFDQESMTSEVIFKNLQIPNSIAFDPEFSRGYFSDSAKRIIYKFDYFQPKSTKQVFVDLSRGSFLPDGAFVDRLGRVWIALWGGSSVACYNRKGNKELCIKLNELNMLFL